MPTPLVLLNLAVQDAARSYYLAHLDQWQQGSPPAWDAWVTILYWSSAAFVLWLAPRGLLTGALCGFYAPASRSLNPFRSHFARFVGRQVILWSIASFVGAALAAWTSKAVAERLNFHYGVAFISICAFLVFDLCGFGFALWRALNRALADEQKSRS